MLNYRRPAFWAVVVSVTAAALAAVCLLTDPVAAKGPAGDPDPNPDATASQEPDDPVDIQLDPWMKEILDEKLTFSSTYNDRAYCIYDLLSFFYGDNSGFPFTIMPGTLAIILSLN